MKEIVATIADDTWCYLRAEDDNLCSNERTAGRFAVSDRLYDFVSSVNSSRCLYVFDAGKLQYVHNLFPEVIDKRFPNGFVRQEINEEIERLCSLIFLLK